jgi:hypothetical protein
VSATVPGSAIDRTLAAYAERFPDERVPRFTPGVHVQCAAVLCDDMGRVLQRKEDRVWRFPLATASDVDESLAAVAERALRTEMAIFDANGEAEPIDVAERGGGLLVSYRFTGGSTAPASVAVSARWSPFDTIRNERLGSKLAAR